jgi:hypothetical protein
MISIPPPNISYEAQAAFKKNRVIINDMLVTRLLAEPGQFDHLGDQAESTLKSGFEFTSAGLEACMLMNDSSLLVDQVRWAKDRLPFDGISMERMEKNLQVYCEVISDLLPKPYAAEIVSMIQDLISVQQKIMKETS